MRDYNTISTSTTNSMLEISMLEIQYVGNYRNDIKDVVIVYLPNGDIKHYGYRIWHSFYKNFHNLELHNLEKPAVFKYDKTGKKSFEWWINGKEITEEATQWIQENKINMNTNEGKLAFKLRWA